MRFNAFSFGAIRIDGVSYEHDVVIDRGQVRKRKKKPSKKFRDAFGHTPLSIEEDIPWECRRLGVQNPLVFAPFEDPACRAVQFRDRCGRSTLELSSNPCRAPGNIKE
jgi:hypothetical protein